MNRLIATTATALMALAGYSNVSAATAYVDSLGNGLLDVYADTTLNITATQTYGESNLGDTFYHPIQINVSNTGNGEYTFDFFLTESKPALLYFSAYMDSQFWNIENRYVPQTYASASFSYTPQKSEGEWTNPNETAISLSPGWTSVKVTVSNYTTGITDDCKNGWNACTPVADAGSLKFILGVQSAHPIPEPSTYALMGLGLAAIGVVASKRKLNRS